MIISTLLRQLDRPWLYRASQAILAPGHERNLMVILEELFAGFDSHSLVLDIGCGPRSLLWDFGLTPIGFDITSSYLGDYRKQQGSLVVRGSADSLPFADSSMDCVFAVGLHHHMPDAMAERSFEEMMRICRPSGKVVVLDAVLPVSGLRRPISYMLRKLDRGGHVRYRTHFESLLPNRESWSTGRRTYCCLGHELLVCVFRPLQGASLSRPVERAGSVALPH